LSKAIPNSDGLSGKIDIVPHADWFGVNGSLDTSRAVARFRKAAADAERRGFDGLRINGSSAWVWENLRARKFREFERAVDEMLEHGRIIAACTFPLTLSGAEEILDAARTHEFAVTLRRGVWKRVEIGNIAAARKEARQMSPKLEQLTFRQREILQRIAQEENTKEIATLLGISVKTVEAHRVQLMRRVKIDNVPGLVRFAIRTGLVSAES
jgi:DNA-binding CsgD family transcriptional regulator